MRSACGKFKFSVWSNCYCCDCYCCDCKHILPIVMFNSSFKFIQVFPIPVFFCHVTHKYVVPETISVRQILKSVRNIVIEPKVGINLFCVPNFLYFFVRRPQKTLPLSHLIVYTFLFRRKKYCWICLRGFKMI